MKTIDYINEIARRNGQASDYRIAQLLGISRQAVSRYRDGGTFDDEVAMKAAELLGVKPEKVVADVHAERAKTPEARKMWESLSKRVAVVSGAAILTGAALLGAPIESRAYSAASINQEYTLYALRRRWLAWLLLPVPEPLPA